MNLLTAIEPGLHRNLRWAMLAGVSVLAPSGSARPAPEDYYLARRVDAALATGYGLAYIFAASGRLASYRWLPRGRYLEFDRQFNVLKRHSSPAPGQ